MPYICGLEMSELNVCNKAITYERKGQDEILTTNLVYNVKCDICDREELTPKSLVHSIVHDVSVDIML